MEVQPGQLYETHYRARNLAGRATTGPGRAERRADARGAVFREDRVLLLHAAAFRAGRGARAGGAFVVDRELPPGIDRLTLSYAFYDIGQANGRAREICDGTGRAYPRCEPVLLPARQPAAVLRVVSLFILMAGAAATLNGAAVGGWVLGLGFLAPVHAVLPLVRRGDPREPGRPLQRAGRQQDEPEAQYPAADRGAVQHCRDARHQDEKQKRHRRTAAGCRAGSSTRSSPGCARPVPSHVSLARPARLADVVERVGQRQAVDVLAAARGPRRSARRAHVPRLARNAAA